MTFDVYTTFRLRIEAPSSSDARNVVRDKLEGLGIDERISEVAVGFTPENPKAVQVTQEDIERRPRRKRKYLNLDATVARAKREVLADVAAGTVPRTCASYSELHDYVDANKYGGAFDRPFNNDESDFWNAVQDAVDLWIKDGSLLAETRERTS